VIQTVDNQKDKDLEVEISGKEEMIMSNSINVVMSREQLYNKIWEISVMGVAKKYNAPYGLLLKLCKEVNIPIPPSGYWTKLNFGKPVTQTPLPDSKTDMITLPNQDISIIKNNKANNEVQNTRMDVVSTIVNVKEFKDIQHVNLPVLPTNALSTEQDILEKAEYNGINSQQSPKYNIYNREILYKEVWEIPVTEVAKKYGVSDVAIHKICKSLDVPTPTNGYWAKVYAGKPVIQTPLPKTNKPAQKFGIRTDLEKSTETDSTVLGFMEDEEREMLLAIADQIQLTKEGAKMHPKIIAHKRTITEWNKNNKKVTSSYRGSRYNSEPSPVFYDSVSEETMPRVFRILDTLIHTMEPLGCILTDDLKFIVSNEKVSIQFSEAKDEIKHVNTKEENMQLLKYEDDRKRYSYASKPNIRKYDHVYNGRLSITVHNTKTYRDCKSYQVEERLGDILVQMYEAADVLRKEREAKEEAERRRKDEERLREERRKRYNIEVERTLALTNLAEDYDIACKIRSYVSAVEVTGNKDEKTLEWIDWAKDKADWYDPTIAREDELLGKREHEKDKEKKVLKTSGYSWW
jgi:hypothetical protein